MSNVARISPFILPTKGKLANVVTALFQVSAPPVPNFTKVDDINYLFFDLSSAELVKGKIPVASAT